MGNILGKQYAITVLTPMPRWKSWLLRAVFGYLRLRPRMTAGLRRLAFIHFARWVVIGPNEFPRVDDDQPREQLSYAYLLFTSNFNGTWDAYIDAFSDAIPGGLDIIWRWSVQYPMSVPITPFKRYIVHNQYWTNYYYSAYPGVAYRDIPKAMRVRQALWVFWNQHRDSDPETFETAFDALIADLQADLGQIGPHLPSPSRTNPPPPAEASNGQ